MRITGGVARGIPLKTPPAGLRPATDRMREAVFSSLGPAVLDANVLDLFAGSGAYGLEALSRGAASCHFVEKNSRCAACLKTNAAACLKSMGPTAPECRLSQTDVFKWQPEKEKTFDLIFIDPPYEIIEKQAPSLFALCDYWLSKADTSRVVFEMPARLTLEPAGWAILKRLGKGSGDSPTAVIYHRKD